MNSGQVRVTEISGCPLCPFMSSVDQRNRAAGRIRRNVPASVAPAIPQERPDSGVPRWIAWLGTGAGAALIALAVLAEISHRRPLGSR